MAQRLACDRLPNVVHVSGRSDALGLGDNVLDGAVIVMSYHDLYWVDEKEGWPKVDAAKFLDQIARALKPGGVLLMVDHSAKAGTDSSAAQTLHRIDEQFAVADFAARPATGILEPGPAPPRRRPQQERLRPRDPRQDRSVRAVVSQALRRVGRRHRTGWIHFRCVHARAVNDTGTSPS